jgi:hypothetical protein
MFDLLPTVASFDANLIYILFGMAEVGCSADSNSFLPDNNILSFNRLIRLAWSLSAQDGQGL